LITDEQQVRNQAICKLLQQRDKLIQFGNQMYKKMAQAYPKGVATRGRRDGSAKSITHFMTTCHGILKDCWKEMNPNASNMEQAVITELVCDIKTDVIKQATSGLIVEQQQAHIAAQDVPLKLTGPGRSKLRYLAGRCVAKSKYAFQNRASSNLYNKNRSILKENIARVRLLDGLEVSQAHILAESEDTESLEETARRQNISCSLLNVSYKTLIFFLFMESKRRELETVEAFHMSGSKIMQEVTESLLNSESLFDHWQDLCEECAEQTVRSVFCDIVSRFMAVANNQYRKTLLKSIGRTKKKAHRTQVEIQHKTTSNLHTMDKFESDTSSGKQYSHLLWKAGLLVNPKYFAHSAFKKTHLQTLGKFYDVKFPSGALKETLADMLCSAITEAEQMSQKSDESQVAGTSTQSLSKVSAERKRKSSAPHEFEPEGKGKGKGKATKQNLDKDVDLQNICVICQKDYNSEEEWVECGKCKRWLDWPCSGLTQRQVQNMTEDDLFTCKQCIAS
jgi:hypothetical protein